MYEAGGGKSPMWQIVPVVLFFAGKKFHRNAFLNKKFGLLRYCMPYTPIQDQAPRVAVGKKDQKSIYGWKLEIITNAMCTRHKVALVKHQSSHCSTDSD